MATSPWIKCPQPVPEARLRLFCIPHAGGGASTFRTWPEALPADVEVRAVQLPGREERLMETPIADVGSIVDALAEIVAPDLDRPWALFGYSMGALVGFELARRLRQRGAPAPAHFCASAYRAPQLPNTFEAIQDLPDAAFLDEVNRRYQAVPAEVRQSPELLELFLPGLRADIAVCDTYAYVEEEPLDCPISAFGGREDSEVSTAELEGWRGQTSGAFELVTFPGDHFFLQTAHAEVLQSVCAALSRTP